MSDHAEAQELLAPYALGAVSSGEAMHVRSHLPDCGICREDLARLSEVVSALPLAVDEVQPPPRLKQRILGTALADAAAASRFAGAETPDRLAADIIRLPRDRLRRTWSRVPGWVPVAAAAAAFAILLTWNAQLQTQVNRSREPAAASVAMAPMTSRAGVQVGEITYLAQQRVALVSLHGMAAPAAGRTYELWVLDARGNASAAGTFLPDGDGSKLLVVAQDLAHKSIAVSDEPGGGSPQPTTSPLITGRI